MRNALALMLSGSFVLLVACSGENGERASALACEPQPLFEGDFDLFSWMTASAGHVYWYEERSNSLTRQAKQGGATERVADGLAPGWAGLASDRQYLYVGGEDAWIHRISFDGSENTALAEAGGDLPQQLQPLGTHLYWASSGDGAEVRRAAIDGTGTVEVLWSTSGREFLSGFAVTEDFLIIGLFNWYRDGLQADGQILRLSADGAQPLVSNLLVPRVVVADDSYVYFTAQNADRDTQLWRVAPGGGTPELLDGGVDIGQALLEGDTLWWSEANRVGAGIHLHRVLSEGASATVAAVDGHHMLGLAGDDTHLYFSTSYSVDAVGPGAVWRVGRQCSIE